MSRLTLKHYMPRSLYGRAALILMVPIVTVQLVVSVVFIQDHFEDVTEQLTRSVAMELSFISDQVDAAGDPASALTRTSALAATLDTTIALPAEGAVPTRRRFYDLSGRKVIEVLDARLPGLSGVDLASDMSAVTLSIDTDQGPLRATFPRSRVSASNPHQLLVLMVAVSALMTLIAFLFLRNQLRPVKRLAEAADAFGKGRTLPYKPSGATEMRAAGSAFLAMRSRIERQIEQRTLMLSGVSHDLRTPLTRMRLNLSMMEEDADTRALQEDVGDMEAMLDAFLDFARAEALDDPEPTDPASLVRAVVEKARRGGQTVSEGALPEPAQVPLRPVAIARALSNLVGNAVRHGTRARVGCTLTPRALVFSVEDDGPGIPEDMREAAVKPFLRLDPARNQDKGGGVGLGLSIAADIARQHGGQLRLADSAELGGLRAEIVIAR
ncbi:two-component system, OmpR family, osmolarity sensor histidine kinase EnvZ [Tranquillimonas rosea]|uniref:histidine kinase n=1 Tax=Tranquillimonas rosea TaxID=641238 RepID=A0A1H9PJ54_9RHOB|nr:ATP-binding protein [Tranquillimonas rosea]SER48167.1 two-component system, OmpR family, osmolarity sensor histidine kinase EnvZ [Tranquillimonas rosea]